MKQLILVITCLLGLFANAIEEKKEFETKGLKTVVIENISGKVSVAGTAFGPKSYVNTTKNKFSDQCKMTIERIDDKLSVKVEKSGGLISKEECDVDIQVNLPEHVDLDLSTGLGNIIINRIRGSLTFKIGSGDLSATNTTLNNINGKSGSGKIHIWNLSGGGEINSGSGSIILNYASNELKGELNIKSGSGNAEIGFPKTAKVKTTFKAGSGELSNSLGDTVDAPFKLSMQTGSGHLKITTHE